MQRYVVNSVITRFLAGVLALLLWPWFAYADNAGPLDPFPITGAYSAKFVRDQNHISIIEIAGDYNKFLPGGQLNAEPRAVVAQEFFRTHPDEYDFLVVFSTFEFDTGDAAAFYWRVQNQVQGIGLPQYDLTDLFGSNHKLQGYIDMADLGRWSMDLYDPEVETTLSVLAHETLHQWSSFVKFKDQGGSDSEALLGRDGAHWSYLLDSDASVQYGSDWKDNGDGTFTSVGTRTFFSPLDLYLMGMYSPEEVPPMALIENSEIDKTLLPQENITISGTKRMVTIEDIIAAEGPRVPSASDSQKEFRFAFILVTGQDENVPSKSLRELNDLRNAFMTRFAILTGGRAVAHVYPQAMPTESTGTPTTVSDDGVRSTPVSYEDAFAWLRSQQKAEGYWRDKESTRGRDTAMVLELLEKMDGSFTGDIAALNWLNTQADQNTDYLSRHALAVVAGNGNATPQRDVLAARQNSDGGWGINSDYRSNPQDTALALLALSTGGGYSDAISRAVTYLEANTHVDGGWSGADGGPGRTTATTLVLQALKAAGHSSSPAVAPGLAWLKTKQNLDGGFGDSPSTVHDTANALSTFIDYEALTEINADASAQYLLGLQTVDGNWSGSNYATVLAVNALRRFNFPNWSITPGINVLPTSPRDGERSELTVVIKNDTNVATPEGVLRFYEGDPGSGGVQIGDDIVVPLMAGGSSLSFTQLWDSYDKVGVRTFYAVVDPDSDQTEMSEKDNKATATITVQAPPPGIDLDIDTSDITLIPTAPNRLPTSMGINVNVRNIGATDANAVRVVVWDTTAEPKVMVGETTIDVTGRTSLVANYNYTLTRPGTTTFKVELDPDNSITEDSESNNNATATVTTTPSIDLVVTPPDLSVDKTPLYLGDDVEFSVKLHNNGTTQNPVTEVKYLVTDGITTQELRTNTIEIPPGGTIEHTVPWRVDMTGNINFTVQMDPDHLIPELDTANNTATLALTSGTANGPNLAASYKEFTATPNPGNEGYAMTLYALVRNTGNQVANDIEVAFYNGDPQQGGVQLGTTQVIATLAASESVSVESKWDQVPTAGDKLLFVVVDPADTILEFSEEDNSAFNVVPVLSLPDLAISSGDIQLNPAYPTPGSELTINAQVTNLGQQDASSVLVRAYLGDPAAGGTLIGDQTIDLIEGNAAGTATFSMTFPASTELQPLVIQVDPEDSIFERYTENNVAQTSVAAQDGDFYVSNRYVSPNGDGVQDDTTLFFRLGQAEDVTLQVVNIRDKVERSISGDELKSVVSGNIKWNGLDDIGRLVPDGDYRLRLVNAAESSLGEVTVNVDTNRSSLLKAANTKYELYTNLTCSLPIVDLNYTDDDEYTYFSIRYGSSPDVSYPRGIYRMAGNGTEIRTIVPESFFGDNAFPHDLRTSNDGKLHTFLKYDSSVPYMDPGWITRWVVEDDGTKVKQATYNDDQLIGFSIDNQYIYSHSDSAIISTRVDSISNPVQVYTESEGSILEDIEEKSLSPDSRHFAFLVRLSIDGTFKLKVFNFDTGETVTVDSLATTNLYDFSWSPDGQKLAVVNGWERQISVFDSSGNLIQVFDFPETLDFYRAKTPAWSLNSVEFAISMVGFTSTEQGYGYGYGYGEESVATGDSTDTGGIYVANILTGAFEKEVEHPGATRYYSYHISTWDGSDWVERGVLHYGMQYSDQNLNLSSFLPDPDGEYKVRVSQVGLQGAHVEQVYLSVRNDKFMPEKAVKLPSGFMGTLESLLGLEDNVDVLSQVRERDAEVLDLHEAAMELHWQSLPPGPLKLHLVAREEDLREFNTLPFSYPEKVDASYTVALSSDKAMVVDGKQQSNDNLGKELFKVLSRPDTGHPPGFVYGYVSNDSEYLYASLDFTVDNTMDGEEDWGAIRVNTAQGWKEYKVTVSEDTYGQVGFTNTAKAGYRHKYYEFKIPLEEIGVSTGDSVEVAFQAYGTAAIIPTDSVQLPNYGTLHWAPGDRALLYDSDTQWAIFLDEEDPELKVQKVFDDWPSNHYGYMFSPTGRRLFFDSSLATNDPTSICYGTGVDTWSFQSLLNMVADLRATRSAQAGGVRLRGTAADLNFTTYMLEYTPVESEQWQPVAPASGHDVVDDEFTTWVPPGPGTYFVRLTVNDKAGNSRRVVRRVSWGETPSITDLYRDPPLYSPNGDAIIDTVNIHYRVLEPVHLEFNFFNADGKKVRTISRDHTLVGAEHNLIWDGRDDEGLPLPDGKYTLRVQNYEFSIEIDITPPALSLELFDAYTYVEVDMGESGKKKFVRVNPRIEWQVSDTNFNEVDLQIGEGISPDVWESSPSLNYYLQLKEKGDGVLRSALLTMETFVNNRMRLQADDKAGNSNSTSTQLGKEELIVSAFGQLDLNPEASVTKFLSNAIDDIYKVISSSILYAPMDDLDGSDDISSIIEPRQTRFVVYETIRKNIVQMDVQYKERLAGVDPKTVAWTQVPVDGYLVPTFEPSEFPVVTSPPDQHKLHVKWTPVGLKPNATYILRLRILDSDGQEHFSNVFSFAVGGISFRGLIQNASIAEYAQLIAPALAKLNPPFDPDVEVGLWGQQFIGRPVSEVQLFVKSADDPRYAVGTLLDSVPYPEQTFIFRSEDLQSCIDYEGYLVFYGEEDASGSRPELGRTGYVPFSLPCLEMNTDTKVIFAEQCGGPSPKKVQVQLEPISGDDSKLTLLTLFSIDSEGGEDVVFNVNDPVSKKTYTYDIDTSGLPEGTLNFSARIINENDDELTKSVEVLVDHTRSTPDITYPLEGQRVCGIPTLGKDGITRNVVTLEGDITDNNKFHFELSDGLLPENAAEVWHDSRSQDSSICYGDDSIKDANGEYICIKKRYDDLHISQSKIGPIAAVFDKTGDISARLHVYDSGGFQQCVTRSFYLDASVEALAPRSDRTLISPNGDQVLDELTITHEVDEPVFVDIYIHQAVLTDKGYVKQSGPPVGSVIQNYSLLPGVTETVWDGTSDGSVVSDGMYYLTVKYRDACNAVATRDLLVGVDVTPPDLDITYPKTVDPLQMMVEVQGTVVDPHLQGFKVEYGLGHTPDEDGWIRLGGGLREITVPEVLALWNTNGLSGEYAIRLSASDTAGNSSEIIVPLNLAERSDLLTYLDVVPGIFSPNGDGRLESTAVRVGLSDKVGDIVLNVDILDSAAAVQKSLASDQTITNQFALNYQWDGRNEAGDTVLADGIYTARVQAELAINAAVNQTEEVQVVVDGTPPLVDVTRPLADGFVKGEGGIVGTISDLHISEYSVEQISMPDGDWEEVRTGTTNTGTDAVLGSLQGLAEGEYQLRITASDAAENITKQTIKFTVDNTPPKVVLNTPEKGTILGSALAPIELTGLVEDPNLAFYTLNIGAGATPDTWTELIRSEQPLSASDILTVLDVSVYQDGIYTIELYAEDKAGNTANSKLQITIDNTAPDAAITTPEETGYIKEPINIVGTADDPNITEYKIYVAPGEKTDAELWSEIGGGTTSVNDGVLINWSALPPDGVNTLKLVVKDKAGNISEVLVQVNVDTHPPSQPTGLVAEVEDEHNVRLSWNANPEPDVVGYHVFRDGVKITTTLVPEPEYLDLDLADSVYEYTVTAVDRAEWESIPSEPATVRLDTTPPTTRISSPSDGGKVSGLYEVRGTAYSEDDFKEYRLYAGRGADPDSWQLLRQSPVPVVGDILSEWNTVILPEGETYVLRLEAEDISGNVGTEKVTVTIDNLPPAAPTGLVAIANNSDVNTDWNDNTEIDLLGYLLYRDDRLVNVHGVVVGDLKPYAIQPSQYLDADLSDGVYTYTVYAIDDAGNVSDSSLPSEVTVDTRPPHAVIVEPEDGHAFDNTQYILATSEDSDIANVQFQYRAEGETDWINLGDPDTQLPYETVFDPTAIGLAYGRYELQAVATDIGDKVDPAPEFITLSYQDLTAPDDPQNLVARVNGGDITLTWDANSAGDLAGYHIDRIDQDDVVTRLTSTPVDVETYLDSGLDDATYRYRIVAIDVSDNESDPSSEATGVVYTPELVQPYYPVQSPATVSLTGKGVVQSTLSGSLVNTIGDQPLPETATDSDGNFILPAIELADGANLFTVVLTDNVGNVSKQAVVEMVVGAAPSQPQGLNASALDYDVTLTWNDNPETNLLGYRVFRNDEPLLQDEQITGLTATSSHSWSYPNYAVDTNHYSYWRIYGYWGDPIEGQWLSVQLPEQRLVSRIEVDFYDESSTIVDYDIESWTGMAWVKVAEVKDNNSVNSVVDLPQPYYSSQLRLVVRKTLYPGESNDQVRIRTFRVYARQFSQIAEYNDTAPDGNHSYTVTAVNNLGFESIPSEPATLPVGDVEPPETVTLSAVVSGSDVLLSWDASISADVVKYHLYRDGELITEHTDLADLTFTDAGRPNGTYIYIVKAVDAAGNESLPSNEASATVSITVLPPPIDLSVTAVPEGGALDLQWAPATGSTPSGYRVMRAINTGGPYSSVADVSDTVYRDSGLENGVRYFYVVVALDAVGNVSAYSNEADGVPQDTVAPDVLMHYPTVPGKIFTTDKKHSAVSGLSEPGASIKLYNNGVYVADATAASELQDVATSIGYSNAILSPDGKLAVMDDGNKNIILYEFSSDTLSSIVSLNTWDDASIEWLSDSSGFVYLDVDDTGNRTIRQYKLSSGDITDLVSPISGNIRRVQISPDGNKLAVIADNYDLALNGIFTIDIASGQWQQLVDGNAWQFSRESLLWSPDGSRLLYHRTSPVNTLDVIDVGSGVITTLDESPTWTKSSWSPDGAYIAATSSRDGTHQIWIFNTTTQEARQITSGPNNHYSPVWTKDGNAIVYYADSSPDYLEAYHLLYEGYAVVLQANNWITASSLHTNAYGYLGVSIDSAFHKITLPGFFSIDGVQLQPGDNIVTATATDESQNTSIPSEAIIINRVLGDQPDLSITQDDLRIIPAAPTIGEKARVTALVHNLGDAPSPQASISLLALDSEGNSVVLAEGDLLNPIIPGGSQAVAADWSVDGDPGTYTLVAIVDQYNTVDELSESNNLALKEILVTDEARPQLSLTIDKDSYSSSEDLLSEVVLTNNGALFSGTLQIVIEDSAGRLVQEVLNQQVSDLAYSESRTINATWNTGNTFADLYQVHASLLDDQGLVISDDIAPFTISAIAGLSSSVTTDRASYGAGDNVRVTGSINYSDGNSMFSNATAYLRLEDSSGSVLAETSKILGDMLPSDSRTVTLDWNTGTSLPGSYPIVLEVKQDGKIVTGSSGVVTINDNGSRLGGSLTLSETTPSRGTPLIASFTVENLGNSTLDQLPITVSVVDPDLQEVVLSYVENQDITPGSTYSSSTSFDTATLSLKNYNVVLQAEVTNSEGVLESVTLQSLNIRVVDRIPPVVSITQPTTGSYIRGNAAVLVSAKDADSKITSVAISVDGGSWQNAPIHDLVNNLYGLLLPGLEEGSHQVQAQATDSAGNTAQSIVVDFTVDNTPPAITIAGVSEGVSYNTAVTPVITIVEENPSQQTIALNTKEYVSGTTITADGNYILSVHAIDLAGNVSTAEVNFIVDTTPPEIIVNGVENDGLYNTDVTPEILVTDTNLIDSTYLLNGQPYTSGDAITEDGEYQLHITAVDIAGNQSDLTITFVIDKTPPVVTITSPDEGATLDTKTTDVLGMTEPEATVFVTLPGYETSVLAFDTGEFSFSGIPLEDGLNTLNFHAVDKAGNTGAVTTLTVMVVLQKAELHGSIKPATGYLILTSKEYLCGGHDNGNGCMHDCYFGRHCNCGCDGKEGCKDKGDCGKKEDCGDKDRCGCGKNFGRNSSDEKYSHSSQTFSNNLSFKKKSKYEGDSKSECEFGNNFSSKGDSGNNHDDKSKCNSEGHSDCGSGGKNGLRCNNCYGKHGKHCKKWHECKSTKLLRLVEAVLHRDGHDYLIVTNERDFVDALRSQRYGTIIVLDDGHLKSSIGSTIRNEIKAQVASGGSFVLLSDADGRWQDIVGAKPRGVIHMLSSVELPDSPASDEGTYALDGRGERIRLYGGIPIGTLNDTAEYPAMVLNSLGSGNSVMLTYDPSDITENDNAETVVTNILSYATSSRSQLIAGEYGNITWLVSELDTPIKVELDEELSVEMVFAEVFDGDITSTNTATWVRQLAESQDTFSAIVKLPFQKGTYQSSVDLFEILDSGNNLLKEETLEIEVAYDRNDVAVGIITTLSTLDLSDVHDSRKRDQALEMVQRAVGIEIGNKRDVEYVLRKLLYAYEKLEYVREPIPDVLSEMGMLIRAYQLEWYEFDE